MKKKRDSSKRKLATPQEPSVANQPESDRTSKATDFRSDETEILLRTLFPGESEMARRMRAFDWSQTDLGPPENWPQNLKTSVRITLTSRHPMFVWWGERLINLYNDGYAAFLHAKHPAALGQPAAAVWPEIWEQVGPRVEFARHRDEGTYDEALPFILYRKGYPEETYVTFSYSPIPDDQGGFGGILCPVTEETERIIGERQLVLLRELAARCADARTQQEACTLAASALETDPADLSFALIYVIDREKRSATMAGISGVGSGNQAAPETVPLDAPSIWPLGEVSSTRRAHLVSDLTAVSGEMPAARGQHPLKQAVAIPIAPSGETGTAAVLVVGLNPLRLFDDSYQRFLELVAGQISAAITNGEAYESERRRAEALAELDRAKTDFFSNVSHEFRTPLTLMLGPLEEELRASPAASERLALAHRNALRLLKLVNTLLDFSRIEAGRMEAVYEPTDLAAYTSDLAGVFRSAIDRAGLKLIVDCPRLSEPAYVDREMWEKIVLNLLSNAFKFTFEGEVKVGLHRREERVELVVADTGVGIPEAELPHVFERFHRVSNTRSRTHEGTGIGLALVEGLVKLHGGEIRVESAEARGTTFTVSVPVGVRHLPKERVGAARARASTATGATPFVEEALRWLPGEEVSSQSTVISNEPALVLEAQAPSTNEEKPPTVTAHILVADDNADMRQYVRHLLAERYTVSAVADGRAALDAARSELPNLILADVMMPRLDGFGLLREVRNDAQLAGVPVVLLSARAGEEATVEGIEAGADDYLIKPFSARELLARIELQIQRKQMEEALRESEARFRSYFELGLIGMAITSPAKGIIEVNDEICKILGYERDELLQKTWAEMTHPDDVAADLAHFNRVMAGEIDGYALDKRWIRKDGQVIDATISVKALRRADGSVAYFVALLQDFTERKRMEAAMRESERFIRHITELSPVMLDVYDLVTGQHPYFSSDVSDLLGYTADEIRQMEDEFPVLMHPEDLPRLRENIERLKQLKDDEINEFECRVRRGDGELRWMVARSMVFARNGQGEVRQVVNATLDITERKRAEEALRQAHDELEQRVIERTSQLLSANDELRREVAERQRAEAQLLVVKDKLAAELNAMKRLHELSTCLLPTNDLQPLLEEVLDATMALLSADFGNVQLCDPTTGALKIVAQRGFQQEFLNYFNSLHEGTASCGMALERRERVIVEDVQTDPSFAPHLKIVEAAGYRAVQSTPLFSHSGEPLGILSTHFREPHRPSERELRLTDLYARQAAEMIERKRTEEELRRSEAYLAEAQRLSHTASWAWNISTGEVFWSEEMFRIYGLDPEQVRPGYPSVMQYIHPEDRARVQQIFEDSVREKREFELAYRVVWPNRTIRHVNNLAHPVFDESDTLIEYIGTTIDTTERVRSEEALRESYEDLQALNQELQSTNEQLQRTSEELATSKDELQMVNEELRTKIAEISLANSDLRNLIDSTDIGTIFLDRELRIKRYTPRVRRLLNILPADLNRPIEHLAHRLDHVNLQEDARRVLADLQTVEREVRSRDDHWYLVRLLPYRTVDERIEGVVVTFIEITERKRAEEALQKTQAELAHVSGVTALGELTASIAHEVNQPLGAIVTNGQAVLRLLARESPDLDKSREVIERMISDGVRASEVITRIRALLKKREAEKVPLDINEIIREVIALTRAELAKSEIHLQTTLAAKLPLVLGDRVQLQQVVLNLILNANEAMSGAGQETRELLITSLPGEAGEVRVAVRDTGSGLDPRDVDRIFEAFFTTRAEGLGLGLSISRTIIEAHGGRLWATLNEGQGVTFQFTLPASNEGRK